MAICYHKFFLPFFFLLASFTSFAQVCPVNIGFEDGTFTHWQCYAGSIDKQGVINITPSDPVEGRHTIWKNTSPQVKDVYGGFPVNCPNGSNYSIQLGNNSVGAQAEGVSYTYTIPADQQNFAIIYYYAVVLQNPNHTASQQPAFQANVKDVSSGNIISSGPPASYVSDISCAAHLFTAQAGLPGFQKSKIDASVLYKDWSPVVINLVGYAGHTIEIDFTTNDCTPGGHFGYAYLDFTEICDPSYDGLILGNKICDGSQNLTLTAPGGFGSYTWYDETMTNILGTSSSLKLDTLPPEHTKYALVVTPYLGLGCVYTLTTEIKKIDGPFKLQVQSSVTGCKADGVDLTQQSLKTGSSDNLKYEYYTDPDGQNYVSDPKLVDKAGIYYIRGSNGAGCTDIQPIEVKLYDEPTLKTDQPAPVCYPATIDLKKTVTSADPTVIFDYYSDAALKIPVASPQAIATSGTYYVKATSPLAKCIAVQTVDIIVSPLPKIQPGTLTGCYPVNLNTYAAPETSEVLTYEFFTDAQGTQSVADPANITVSGTYYYKALNQYSCESNIAPLDVTVYPPAVFKVTDPAPVVYPQTINLQDTYLPVAGLTFTYWQDKAATKPLTDYQNVIKSGTYYVKATTAFGCTVINPVHVLVNDPPEGNMLVNNTFSPNGDGINDEFNPSVTGIININYLKIYNRYGKQVFETKELANRWDGTNNGKPQPSGTYYWVFSCFDTYFKKTVVRSGSVTIIR